MDLSNLGSTGVVVVGTVYLLDLIFKFINKNSTPKWASLLEQKVEDLHVWHGPDSNGEMTWKNSRMIDCVEKLTDVVNRQTNVMERLMPVLDRLEKKL